MCPTEIAEFNKHTSDFADRDTILIGASTDSEYVHLARYGAKTTTTCATFSSQCWPILQSHWQKNSVSWKPTKKSLTA